MLNYKNKSLITTIVVTSLTLVLASNLARAEIYKWRNARGVIQYSDTPPIAGASKVPRSEMVNVVQKKDVCSVSPANTSTKKSNLMASVVLGVQSLGSRVNDKVAGLGFDAIGRGFNSLATNSFPSRSGANRQRFDNGITTFSVAETKPKNTLIASNTPPRNAQTSTKPLSATSTQAVAPVVVANAGPLPTLPAPSTDTSTNIVQKDLMPAVDISQNANSDTVYIDKRIMASNLAKDQAPVGDGNGQFRIDCGVSHMSNDDPLVYPNQQGVAHHHTFFGNTLIDYKTNPDTVATTGNSTCRGGIANRSAYWIPSIIDTATNTPMKPYSSLWYYKTGYIVPKELIKAPPKGLRMIGGNMKATSAQAARFPEFTCFKEGSASPPASKYIPACPQGWTIVEHIALPQCWDGKNLDSPDHKSHMTDVNPDLKTPNRCPESHPIAIPSITLNIKYLITDPKGTANWRLSSDNYAKNGYNAGYSAHADWINGWDETVIKGVIKNCLNAGKDCGNHMLGDGTIIY